MSTSGTLAYFTEHAPAGREETVRRLFSWLGRDSVNSALLFRHPQTPVRRAAIPPSVDPSPSVPGYLGIEPSLDVYVDHDEAEQLQDDYEWVKGMSLEELLNASHRWPTIHTGVHTPAWRVYGDAIERDIPRSVSGGAYVGEPSIVIGPYDVYDAVPVIGDPIHYYGRSEIALGLYGHGTPNDWDTCRRMIFEIPEFKQLETELQSIMGPVKRCIIWRT